MAEDTEYPVGSTDPKTIQAIAAKLVEAKIPFRHSYGKDERTCQMMYTLHVPLSMRSEIENIYVYVMCYSDLGGS